MFFYQVTIIYISEYEKYKYIHFLNTLQEKQRPKNKTKRLSFLTSD